MRLIKQCACWLTLAAAAGAAAAQEPCEEPDFGFFAGSPYTQGALVPQVIWQTGLFVDREHVGGDRVSARALESVATLELGITDELELDIATGYAGAWAKVEREPAEAADGALDTLVGLRYRILREERHGITLAAGPFLILPTGDEDEGFGSRETGYGIDVSAARDFGFGYAYLSFNWERHDDVRVAPGASRRADEDAFTYAAALAWKAIEYVDRDYRQDLHVHLELAGAHEDVGPEGIESFVLALGARYGFMTPAGRLFEIGLAVPFGLDDDAPDWGVVLQVQYELPFGDD